MSVEVNTIIIKENISFPIASLPTAVGKRRKMVEYVPLYLCEIRKYRYDGYEGVNKQVKMTFLSIR